MPTIVLVDLGCVPDQPAAALLRHNLQRWLNDGRAGYVFVDLLSPFVHLDKKVTGRLVPTSTGSTGSSHHNDDENPWFDAMQAQMEEAARDAASFRLRAQRVPPAKALQAALRRVMTDVGWGTSSDNDTHGQRRIVLCAALPRTQEQMLLFGNVSTMDAWADAVTKTFRDVRRSLQLSLVQLLWADVVAMVSPPLSMPSSLSSLEVTMAQALGCIVIPCGMSLYSNDLIGVGPVTAATRLSRSDADAAALAVVRLQLGADQVCHEARVVMSMSTGEALPSRPLEAFGRAGTRTLMGMTPIRRWLVACPSLSSHLIALASVHQGLVLTCGTNLHGGHLALLPVTTTLAWLVQLSHSSLSLLSEDRGVPTSIMSGEVDVSTVAATSVDDVSPLKPFQSVAVALDTSSASIESAVASNVPQQFAFLTTELLKSYEALNQLYRESVYASVVAATMEEPPATLLTRLSPVKGQVWILPESDDELEEQLVERLLNDYNERLSVHDKAPLASYASDITSSILDHIKLRSSNPTESARYRVLHALCEIFYGTGSLRKAIRSISTSYADMTDAEIPVARVKQVRELQLQIIVHFEALRLQVLANRKVRLPKFKLDDDRVDDSDEDDEDSTRMKKTVLFEDQSNEDVGLAAIAFNLGELLNLLAVRNIGERLQVFLDQVIYDAYNPTLPKFLRDVYEAFSLPSTKMNLERSTSPFDRDDDASPIFSSQSDTTTVSSGGGPSQQLSQDGRRMTASSGSQSNLFAPNGDSNSNMNSPLPAAINSILSSTKAKSLAKRFSSSQLQRHNSVVTIPKAAKKKSAILKRVAPVPAAAPSLKGDSTARLFVPESPVKKRRSSQGAFSQQLEQDGLL